MTTFQPSRLCAWWYIDNTWPHRLWHSKKEIICMPEYLPVIHWQFMNDIWTQMYMANGIPECYLRSVPNFQASMPKCESKMWRWYATICTLIRHPAVRAGTQAMPIWRDPYYSGAAQHTKLYTYSLYLYKAADHGTDNGTVHVLFVLQGCWMLIIGPPAEYIFSPPYFIWPCWGQPQTYQSKV